ATCRLLVPLRLNSKQLRYQSALCLETTIPMAVKPARISVASLEKVRCISCFPSTMMNPSAHGKNGMKKQARWLHSSMISLSVRQPNFLRVSGSSLKDPGLLCVAAMGTEHGANWLGLAYRQHHDR